MFLFRRKPKETLIFKRPPGLVAICFYKTIWGIGEVALGFFMLFFVNGLIRQELLEDPQDIFVHFLIYGAHVRPETSASIGNLFIFFGTVKLIIALSLWFRSRKMRHVLIVFLAMITSFAFVDAIFRYTPFKIVSFIADAAILFYLWKVIPHHFTHPEYKKGLAEE
jgi:uncharacterized membrane protein